MTHLLSTDAEAELDEIWRYVALGSGSIDIADRLLDSITDCFSLLARFPYIGRRRDHDLRPGLRTFPVGEYMVIYRIDEDAVTILHVMRGSRNIQGLLSK